MPDKIENENRESIPFPKKRLMFLFAVIALFVLGATVWKRFDMEKDAPDALKKETERKYEGAGVELDSIIAKLQRDKEKRNPPAPVPVVVPQQTAPVVAPKPEPIRIYVQPRVEKRVVVPDEDMIKLGAQLRARKILAMQATSTLVNGFDEIKKQSSGTSVANEQQAVPQYGLPDISSLMGGSGTSAAQPQAQADQNNQQAKQAFLYEQGQKYTPQGYSANIPIPQQFPLELKAGTVIPGIMISGLNSDLPGAVMGQVSEHVYDTATGANVLIPKGSRLIGVYDSKITYGQRRALVVWNKIVAPDGTSLNISGSQGMDAAGYAGMTGRVDEHWGKLIGTALIASMFVAGAEIISPSDDDNDDSTSVSEAVSTAVANTVLEVGARLINKVSEIQPTIKIRPGAKFNVFVTQDIIFPAAWTGNK